MNQLKQETEFFNEHVESWKKHLGKFVLVVGKKLGGFYESPREAYQSGLEKFGDRPMLIQHLQDGSTATAPAPLSPLSRP